jgi:hypothetical protein
MSTLTSAPVTASPTSSGVSVPAISSVSTAYVRYPKAVPGRSCTKSHRRDWTRTKKYGKVKCLNRRGHSEHIAP